MRGKGGAGIIDRHAILERKFSTNMKRIMKEKELTFIQLSKLTGFPPSTLHNYTNGRRVNLTRAFIIAVALGVSWDELLGVNWEQDTIKEFKELGIIKGEVDTTKYTNFMNKCLIGMKNIGGGEYQ